ncbi:hypothetical protein BHE74_00051309 [Ensete ventricosum]|nr:hypothetical protein BHE74_00051309 [Ensete ventricosum]
MKGALRHMHLISEKHLIEGLRPQLAEAKLGSEGLSTGQEDIEAGMIRAVGELNYFSAHIHLREPDKSEDKTEGRPTDRKERDADVRQQIVGLWATSVMVPQRQDFHGVIDLLLSWRESIGRKRGQGGGECRGKFQVSRQDKRKEVNKLYKISINRLLIKIAESGGLRVDVGVLDQGTK